MKKLAALVTALIMMFLLSACTYGEEVVVDGYHIMYGNYVFENLPNWDGTAVGFYEWDGDDNNMDVVIPDEYDGMKIRCLGGYLGTGLPCPFTINITRCLALKSDPGEETANWMGGYFDAHKDELSEIIYKDFNLYLGKNIESIYCAFHPIVYTINGEKIAYIPRVRVYCDEDNYYFYSEDGKLYHRGGTPVEGFIYVP